MIVGVAAMLILPALLKPAGTRDVGVTGPAPAALAATIAGQAQAAGITARVHPYASVAAAEQAVRQGRLDVLVADARRLEWKGKPDEQLKTVVTGAIQLATVRERAAAAGISPGALARPAGAGARDAASNWARSAGRSPGDETAVLVMTVVLFFGISVFGQMVLTGVLEEKASRVVEVLLARIPARALLAGKIAGIGLLGLAQIGVTALAALVAVSRRALRRRPRRPGPGAGLGPGLVRAGLHPVRHGVRRPRIARVAGRGRPGRRRAGHGRDDGGLLRLVRDDRTARQRCRPGDLLLPADRAHGHARAHRHGRGRLVGAGGRRRAHPGRHRRAGACSPGASTPGPSSTAGRRSACATSGEAKPHPVPAHSGAGTREAVPPPQPADVTAGGRTTMTGSELTRHRWLITVLTGVGVVVGVAVAVFTADVIIGVAAGAGFIAVANQMVRLWTRHAGPPVAHR